MEIFLTIVLGAIALFAVFWLYRVTFFISMKLQRRSLKQQGRIITWPIALKRVTDRHGYILIAKFSKQRQLYYVEGQIPKNPIDLRQDLDKRAAWIEGYPGRVSLEELRGHVAKNNCVELNTNGLIV